MDKTMVVNEKEYRIVKLLGKGKGGYSYLAQDGAGEYVLKQIHHEPCDYYQFGNKIEAEIRDYERLKAIGIKMPALLDVDVKNERILKEYIEGDTVYELVLQDKMKADYFEQIRGMCALLYAAHTNIDYFPTNFVVKREELYYIDFECNDYMDEWNFENWGIKYWSKTPEFLKYVEVTLIRANLDDAKEIHTMQVEAFKKLLEKYQDFDISPASESREKVEARLRQEFTYYYFICVGRQKVGAVRVVDTKEAGRNKRISPIFILPEFQGKGIAQKAIRLCEELHGNDSWELDTILQERENCHLYEKMGYRQTGKTEVVNERMTLVFYEKNSHA